MGEPRHRPSRGGELSATERGGTAEPASRPLRMAAVERWVATGMAAAALGVFAVLWRPWQGGARLGFFAFGAGFAGALAGAAGWGNRLAGSFAAFLVAVFAPWDFLFLLGSPYLVLAAWLAVRANRASAGSKGKPSGAKSGGVRPTPSRGGRVTPRRRGRT